MYSWRNGVAGIDTTNDPSGALNGFHEGEKRFITQTDVMIPVVRTITTSNPMSTFAHAGIPPCCAGCADIGTAYGDAWRPGCGLPRSTAITGPPQRRHGASALKLTSPQLW